MKVHNKLTNVIKVSCLLLLVLTAIAGAGANELFAKGRNGSVSVAELDPDKTKSLGDDEMRIQATTMAQPDVLNDELNFIYSRRTGGDTITIYNNETLSRHSYIAPLGYLMEYLGVNQKDKDYYDVRLQGGVYALDKADVDRFIPLSEIKSFPYYENKNGMIVHHVEGRPWDADSWYMSSTLGQAPSWMKAGQKYYSFSGIYFTDSPAKLGEYSQQKNAVNSNDPYYDYYLYQPARTKTNASAEQLDSAFNTLVGNASTQMTNTGADFIAAQDKYGINALLMFAMAIHESDYGRSNFARDRNNLFGVDAVDSNPGQAARFASIPAGIAEQGNYLSWVYADADYQSGANYYGSNLGTKSSGMNVKYASDPYWGEKIAHHYARIDRSIGSSDYQKYGLAIARQGTPIYWNKEGTDKAHVYKKSTSLLTYMYPVAYFNEGSMTEIALEPPYSANKKVEARHPDGGSYAWNRAYVSPADIMKISAGTQSSADTTNPDDENKSNGDSNSR